MNAVFSEILDITFKGRESECVLMLSSDTGDADFTCLFFLANFVHRSD